MKPKKDGEHYNSSLKSIENPSVVPGSEKERRKAQTTWKKVTVSEDVEVIEIISSDESGDESSNTKLPSSQLDGSHANLLKRPDDEKTEDEAEASEREVSIPRKTGSAATGKKAQVSRKKQSHRIIYSSESSDDDNLSPASKPASTEVIEISSGSDSGDESSDDDVTIPPSPVSLLRSKKLRESIHDESYESDDGTILTLDDPKSARKPVRLLPPNGILAGPNRLSQMPSTPVKLRATDPSTPHTLRADSTPHPFPALPYSPSSWPLVPPRTPAKPRTPAPARLPRTPRTSKKALALAAQADLEAYAQELFDELNEDVFKGGLPASTKLVWSKRLLTTAGRAKWHRSKDGVHTTEIEMATKVLDSKERIRNTLSHEMCHLACWIINQEAKEGHGKVWKSWAARVMRKRDDIEISTRHDYEISYPYQWECADCAKTYGRFSKSIRPDEVLCGACKTGKLQPLFSVRATRTPKTKAGSNLAADKARDSPRTIAHVDSDVELLANTVGGLRIEE